MQRLVVMFLVLWCGAAAAATDECRRVRMPAPVLSYERRPEVVFRDLVRTIDRRRPGSLDPAAVATSFLNCLDSIRQLGDSAPPWMAEIDLGETGIRIGDTVVTVRPTRSRAMSRWAARVNRDIFRALDRRGPTSDREEIMSTLWHGWVEGLIAVGNRFDDYVYADQIDADEGQRRGRVFTVGFQLRLEDGGWVVSEILEDHLVDAGVEPGARLVRLNGRALDRMNHREWVRLWSGKDAFAYRATFLAGGEELEVASRAVPRRIRTDEEPRLDSVGYVRIQRFAQETRIELRRALRTLADVEGLVLDLRSNPGGALDVGLIDIFFRPDQILTTHREFQRDADTQDTNGTVEYEDRPIVLLIDRASASMSETLAAAVRQNERGLLVGEVSFGKGVSQAVIDIGRDGKLNLVERMYFYPGTTDTWHEVGVEPHHRIELTESEREQINEALDAPVFDLAERLSFDPVLSRAVDLLKEQEP